VKAKEQQEKDYVEKTKKSAKAKVRHKSSFFAGSIYKSKIGLFVFSYIGKG
jgi:hypothetical protein